MKVLVLGSWLCLIIFLQTLPYSTCKFTPKSTNHELIFPNENKEKMTKPHDHPSSKNCTMHTGKILRFRVANNECMDVHKVVHQRRGVYGGADLLRKGPKKNEANYIFERPILVSSFFLFLFVAFTL
ncbi:PREDICTED: uncharacterized protein LOC109242117 [Nicotiana attenuata]|uniref:uncharacterized protein LOC109242117 n=1 Tax=Nicotiana attenuata TaxID=49451 RepID=UPI000904FC15|nr:PREDICTED: uncharacterized protein LOC109242117 [Nicotiana attenuata]